MHCLDCEYDLRGSVEGGVCPECGRGFDVGDAGSYREGFRLRVGEVYWGILWWGVWLGVIGVIFGLLSVVLLEYGRADEGNYYEPPIDEKISHFGAFGLLVIGTGLAVWAVVVLWRLHKRCARGWWQNLVALMGACLLVMSPIAVLGLVMLGMAVLRDLFGR